MAQGITGSIGVFDSGLGGLSLVQALKAKLPRESILYFADLKHLPYGSKTDAEVIQYSLEIGRYLQERGAKVLLVACSTASAVAREVLTEALEIPVVTVMNSHFLEEILEGTQTGHVAVISTPLTAKSGMFARWIEGGYSTAQVYSAASLPLVNAISAGELDFEEISTYIHGAVDAILNENPVDQIVLGCTHFNFVKDVFETVLPPNVRVASAPVPAANHIAELLKMKEWEAESSSTGTLEVIVSENEPVFENFVENLFGLSAEKFTLFSKQPV